jgi:serine O-acetyltransferase
MSSRLLPLVSSDLARYNLPCRATTLVRMLITDPGFLAAWLLRCQMWGVRRSRRWLPSLIRSAASILTGADFVPGCSVGAGLLVHHPQGIVLGKESRVGAQCTMSHGVTLGERYTDGASSGYPIVGDEVVLGAGASVLGPVAVGAGATIGAHSLVLRDVEAGTVVGGVPARFIRAV